MSNNYCLPDTTVSQSQQNSLSLLLLQLSWETDIYLPKRIVRLFHQCPISGAVTRQSHPTLPYTGKVFPSLPRAPEGIPHQHHPCILKSDNTLDHRVQEVPTMIGKLFICHCLCLLPGPRCGLFLTNLLERKKNSLSASSHLQSYAQPSKVFFSTVRCLPFQVQFISGDVQLPGAVTVQQRRSSSPEWSGREAHE